MSETGYRKKLKSYLEGKVVRIPLKLRTKLNEFSRERKGRDAAACLYFFLESVITQNKRENEWKSGEKRKKSFVPIHHERIYDGLPFHGNTIRNSLLLLKELKLLQVYTNQDGVESYRAKYESKRYKLAGRGKKVDHHLEHEKTNALECLESFTDEDPLSRYQRECLQQLQLNEDLFYLTYFYVAAGKATPDRVQKGIEPQLWLDDNWKTIYALLKSANNLGRIKRDNYGRLHSPFTGLKREYRGCFTVDGEELLGLDMSTCQPMLLAMMSQDKQLQKDCLAGVFYERIANLLRVDREAAKESYCKFAYGPIRKRRQKSNADAFQIQDLFGKSYKVASKFIAEEKRHNSDKFSHRLQRAESKIFIDGALRAMKEIGVFCLSVHDGLYFRRSDKKTAQKVIEAAVKRGVEEIDKDGQFKLVMESTVKDFQRSYRLRKIF